MSDSEDENDVFTQMLQKNLATKHFNHINCNQKLGQPILYQARPKGQSRKTSRQKKLIRDITSITHVQKCTSLFKKLSIAQSQRMKSQVKLPNLPDLAVNKQGLSNFSITKSDPVKSNNYSGAKTERGSTRRSQITKTGTVQNFGSKAKRWMVDHSKNF